MRVKINSVPRFADQAGLPSGLSSDTPGSRWRVLRGEKVLPARQPGSRNARNSRFADPYRRRFPGAGNFSVQPLDFTPGAERLSSRKHRKTGNRNAAGNEWSNGNGTHEEHRPRPPPGRPQRGARRAGPAPVPGTGPAPGDPAAAVHAALTANPGGHHRRHRHRRRDQPPRRPRRPDRAGDRRRRHPHQGRQARHPGHLDPDRPRPRRERARRRPRAGRRARGHQPARRRPRRRRAGRLRPAGRPAAPQEAAPAATPAPAQRPRQPGLTAARRRRPCRGTARPDEDTAASHEQDETAPPADGSAPAGAPPDPALVAEIAGHIGQIQAAASAAATVLAGGGDLRAVRAGLDEIYEQAAQARRAAQGRRRREEGPGRPAGRAAREGPRPPARPTPAAASPRTRSTR